MAKGSVSQLFGKASSWYEERPANERRILLIGGVVVLLIVLWIGVWQPAHEFAVRSERRYEGAQEAVSAMRDNEARLQEAAAKGGGSKSSLDTQGFMSEVTASAQRQKINLSRIEPAGDRKLRVAVDKAPFNDVISWIEQMASQKQIMIDQISVDRTDQPGIVNVRVTLQI